MTTVAWRAADAVARQAQWELDLTALLEPPVARFLRGVIGAATNALQAPTLLAAADPFTFTNIRKRWDTTVRLILTSTPASKLAHPALLDEHVAGVLRAADLPDRAAAMAVDVLTRGRDEGWTQAKTKRELRAAILPSAPKVQGPKAGSKEWAWYKASVRRIARTAATRAQSIYTLDAGGFTHKRWLTQRDATVRVSHAQAHGQTVSKDGVFMVGGYPMQYPGDTTAPPAERENCRCLLIMVDQDEDEIMPENMPDVATLVDIPAYSRARIGLAGEPVPDTLTASGAKLPPKEWFDDPRLDGPTRLTVTDDGRVFGHIAVWETCHVGYSECKPPPRSPSNYAYFHNGAMRVRGPHGVERIPVGKITAGSGHAGERASPLETIAHYDNTGTTAAYLRAGEDRHGIWVAGIVAPGATEEQIVTLEAHPPSGDWRDLGNGLDLLAVLCVNTNGFQIPLVAGAFVAGRQVSLVAAGQFQPDLAYAPGPEIEYVRRLMRADEAAALARKVATARAKGRVVSMAAKRRKERGRHGLQVQRQG